MSGQPREAAPAVEEAVRLADAKGDLVHARRGRRLLEDLAGGAAQPT